MKSLMPFLDRNPCINNTQKERKKHSPALGVMSDQRRDVVEPVLTRFQAQFALVCLNQIVFDVGPLAGG